MSVPNTIPETTIQQATSEPPVPPTSGDLPPNPTDLVIETSVAPVSTIGSIGGPAEVAPSESVATSTTNEIPHVPAPAPTTIASVGTPKEVIPVTGVETSAGRGGAIAGLLGATALLISRIRRHPHSDIKK